MCRQPTVNPWSLWKLQISWIGTRSVSHMTALLDDCLRAQGINPPYDGEKMMDLIKQYDDLPMLHDYSCISEIADKEFPPIIRWQVQPSKEFRIKLFAEYMQTVNLLERIIHCNPKIYTEDGAEIIQKFKKPRITMECIESYPGLYAILDYILRYIKRDKVQKTPYPQEEMDEVLQRYGWGFCEIDAENYQPHEKILSKQAFEVLMGLKRLEYVPFESNKKYWIEKTHPKAAVVYPSNPDWTSTPPKL